MQQDFISWEKNGKRRKDGGIYTYVKIFIFSGEVLVSYEHIWWCLLEVFRAMKAFKLDINCSSQEAF